MSKLTANEIKTKGVGIFDEVLKDEGETVISVRGKDKYVVMDLDRYNYLRVCELNSAYKETMDDHESGNYVEEDVEDHIQRLDEEV